MKSKVIILRTNKLRNQNGNIDFNRVLEAYRKGFQRLTNFNRIKDALESLFPSNEKIGIKVNTIGGRSLSTLPEVSFPLGKALTEGKIKEENIVIWDRTERELKEAGYRLNMNRNEIKVLATDSPGVNYEHELIAHLNIGSLFSSIQTRWINSSISLALLKDHGLAGVTAGMKNYFGAIHNPNKYHDSNCNPFVAELFDTEPIKKKHKITILDCTLVQFHKGPAYHSRWAKKYDSFVFSLDPVAADFIGWKIIEELRAKSGLPSLEEEKRAPLYLYAAERMGLGKANLNMIEIIEEEI